MCWPGVPRWACWGPWADAAATPPPPGGPLLRGTAGEVLRVRVDNRLPQPTAVHWHGLAIRNDMDGVPNLTQPEIAPGAAMDYEFALPRPGTYFYHAHHGVQRERGLYGPLIIDDPQDPTARPGQRARIRLINASGERYDLQVTLGEGAFPLVALAEGKGAQALGVVRTAGGAAPPADVQPAALTRQQLTLNDLQAPPEARLDDSATPTSHDVFLTGGHELLRLAHQRRELRRGRALRRRHPARRPQR